MKKSEKKSGKKAWKKYGKRSRSLRSLEILVSVTQTLDLYVVSVVLWYNNHRIMWILIVKLSRILYFLFSLETKEIERLKFYGGKQSSFRKSKAIIALEST